MTAWAVWVFFLAVTDPIKQPRYGPYLEKVKCLQETDKHILLLNVILSHKVQESRHKSLPVIKLQVVNDTLVERLQMRGAIFGGKINFDIREEV